VSSTAIYSIVLLPDVDAGVFSCDKRKPGAHSSQENKPSSPAAADPRAFDAGAGYKTNFITASSYFFFAIEPDRVG